MSGRVQWVGFDLNGCASNLSLAILHSLFQPAGMKVRIQISVTRSYICNLFIHSLKKCILAFAFFFNSAIADPRRRVGIRLCDKSIEISILRPCASNPTQRSRCRHAGCCRPDEMKGEMLNRRPCDMAGRMQGTRRRLLLLL